VSALPGFLTRNWTLKLSAFGIALLLWVSVRVEAPSRQTISGVPVRVDLGDPQWAVVEDPSPRNVSVRFAGPSRELIRLSVDRPAIVIPLDQVTSSDTTIVLRNQWVRVQDRPNVVVEDIQPSTVTLRLESIERVELPVAPRLEGTLDERWALAARPRAAPAEVRVSGPRGRVMELDSIRLLPVDLSTVEESGRVMVGVDAELVTGLQVQPAQVEVEVRVEARVERSVADVPVELDLGEEAELYELSPPAVEVTLTGARSLVEGIDAESLRVLAELGTLELPEEPGEEITVPLVVRGLPELVEGRLEPNEVVIVRLETEPEEDPATDAEEDSATDAQEDPSTSSERGTGATP